VFFFFSSRRRHTRSYGDWSSDVCSSDLLVSSPPWPGELSVPVTLSPSTFNFSVILRSAPPLRPGVVHVHVPDGSAFLSSSAARLDETPARLNSVQIGRAHV